MQPTKDHFSATPEPRVIEMVAFAWYTKFAPET